MYKHQYETSHDLSVIGNGTPTVVQVHDPGCALCRKLRDNVAAVEGEFGGRIQFRIADISTSQGRKLANQYEVPHVTLLLFGADGELVATMAGVRSPDALRRGFENFL